LETTDAAISVAESAIRPRTEFVKKSSLLRPPMPADQQKNAAGDCTDQCPWVNWEYGPSAVY
jgi:hypothetical protein